jgi:hypothetical protein
MKTPHLMSNALGSQFDLQYRLDGSISMQLCIRHIETLPTGVIPHDYKVYSIGVKYLPEVDSYQINTVAGIRTHLIQFVNGGILKFSFHENGVLVALEAAKLSCDVLDMERTLFYCPHNRKQRRPTATVPENAYEVKQHPKGVIRIQLQDRHSKRQKGGLAAQSHDIQSIGVKHLNEIMSYTVNTIAGSRSHVIHFINGGMLRFAYQMGGALLALETEKLTCEVSETDEMLFYCDAKSLY